MVILVTGSTGFVGKHIIKYLEKKYVLRQLVRKKTAKVKRQVVEGSLADEKSIDKAVKGCDIIIHAAAILDAEDPNIFEVNIRATQRLVKAARKYKVKQFIFISTENVVHDCPDAYSQSKKIAEEEVRKFRNHTILREPVVYGPGDKRYLGKVIEAIKHWPGIPLPAGGKFTLQPIYVEDIGRYIEQAIKLKIKGTYLVTGAESITYKELVKKVMQLMHRRKVLIPVPLAPLKIAAGMLEFVGIRPPLTTVQLNNMILNRRYDIQEQIKVFKISPTPLEEGLRKTIGTKSL